MVNISIFKNKILTNGASFENEELADLWLTQEVTNNSWGKPERWVSFQGEPDAGYTDTRINELKRTEYFYPAEYSIVMTDISAQINQQQINAAAEEYLKNTDWIILRELDSGVACPADIKAARATARAQIIK